jgi:hypothetical protein
MPIRQACRAILSFHRRRFPLRRLHRRQPRHPQPGGTGAPSSALDAFDRFRQGTNYQWRLNQGANALTSNLARGTLDSGAAQKSILEYGQNFASNELSNYMNLLASQQASGLTAAGAVMGVNTNYQGNVTANNNNAANASSNAALVAGQGQANMWGGVANAGGQIGGALFQYGMRPTDPDFLRSVAPVIEPGRGQLHPRIPDRRLLMTVEEQIADLEARAKARRGKPGFSENVRELDALIAELKSQREAQSGD